MTLYLPAEAVEHMRELARRFKWPVGVVAGSCITDVWERVTGNKRKGAR